MDAVKQPIRILFAEDLPADVEMARREIKKGGIEFISTVVDTEPDFIRELDEFKPDIVVSDYSMPGFNGLTALKITRKQSPETPFIILTGSINEETAVKCLKAGAVDYVLKESLKRLGQAILNALEQKNVKEKKREAEKLLKQSEERFRRLAQNAQDMIFRYELFPERKFSFVNQAALQITGYSPEEYYTDPDLGFKIVHPEDRRLFEKMNSGKVDIRKPLILRWIKKDGTVIWTEDRNIHIYDHSGKLVAVEGISRDITEQKLNEQQLIQSEKEYSDLINGMNETVWIIHPKGKLLNVNKRAVEVLGFSRKELLEIGLSGIDNYLTDDEIISLTESMEADKFQFFHTRHTTKSGKVIPVEISSRLINYRGETAILSVARDISERIRIEDELRLLSRSVEQSPVSIVITDNTGKIEYVNTFFTKLTGYTLNDVKGSTPRVFKSGEQTEPFYKNLWETILGGNEWRGELMNKKKNGELFWEDISISPVTNKKGKITHFVSVREDITEKKKMIDDLIIAKEKAEESDRLKSAFLANMSHEVRTPMNGIMGFTELLKEPKLTGKEKDEYIKIIQKSGQRMLNTINDLIEISKIESGSLEVKLSTVKINEQLEYIYQFFKPETKAKGLVFSCYTALSDEEAVVDTDQEKLNGVLMNLIKNAIKYTSSGEIEFGYRLAGKNLEFFVNDTGIGIEKQHRKMVFERFSQADISLSKPYEGAGLGLSIAKAYTEIMGGEIGFNSDPGKGSQFFFTIPFVQNDTQTTKTEPVKNQPNGDDILKKLTILVAEDDTTGQIFISELLKGKCKKIFIAENGKEAVQLFSENSEIDLVLMDIKMPVMDGYEATAKIKEINPDTVIIAQTAYTLSGDKEKIMEAGCDDYLPKPFPGKRLTELVWKHFG